MKHCLVVDESRIIRKVVCHLLEEMKFYAEEATENASALEACRAQMPDVVLANLGKPGGLEFLRALRRDKSGKQPVIIASMVEHDADHIGHALAAGANEFVLKPFDRGGLEEKFAAAGLM